MSEHDAPTQTPSLPDSIPPRREPTVGQLGLCGRESMDRTRAEAGLPPAIPEARDQAAAARLAEEETPHSIRNAEGDDHAGPCAHPPLRPGVTRAEPGLDDDDDPKPDPTYTAPRVIAVEKGWDEAGKTSGRVAWGACWPDGTVVTRTLEEPQDFSIHTSVEGALRFHGSAAGSDVHAVTL